MQASQLQRDGIRMSSIIITLEKVFAELVTKLQEKDVFITGNPLVCRLQRSRDGSGNYFRLHLIDIQTVMSGGLKNG